MLLPLYQLLFYHIPSLATHVESARVLKLEDPWDSGLTMASQGTCRPALPLMDVGVDRADSLGQVCTGAPMRPPKLALPDQEPDFCDLSGPSRSGTRN